MNTASLQRWIDRFVEASRQQWLMRFAAVAASLGAVLATSAADRQWWPVGLLVVPVLALATTIHPDSHAPLVVVGVVVGRWLATIDHLDTLWLPVAAINLLVYHSLLALAATVPTGGELPVATLRRWRHQTLVVSAVTVGMWGLVAMLDRRDASGSAFLTTLALALVLGAAVLIRSRSLGRFR